jgi:hypothetical protein
MGVVTAIRIDGTLIGMRRITAMEAARVGEEIHGFSGIRHKV